MSFLLPTYSPLFWYLMNNLEAWQNKKRYKHLVYSVFIHFDKKDVEPQGIEPWSKHIRRKPSTCLVLH